MEEVEKCKLSTLSNSEPATMITGVRDLKNVLLSLNQETKKVIASYRRSKLFDKAKQAATDFRYTYESAKIFVRNCNDKLSQMNLERQSSLETMSHVDDQVQDGGLSPHHESYHSRVVEPDPEVYPSNPPRKDAFPALRSSSRSTAPTRLTLEKKENEAKDHVLAALRTPQGLSNESSDKLHEYVGKVKSRFLVYKEIYLDFRDWLSAHGSTAEQTQLKAEYGDVLLECNFLIRNINDILKDRNMETCSVLGSITAPMAQDDAISLDQLSLLDAWEHPMVAEVASEPQPKVRFVASSTAPSKELGPSDTEKKWLDDLAKRFDRHLSSIKTSAESPKESKHDPLVSEPVHRSGNYMLPPRTRPDVEERQHLAAERDLRFGGSPRIYPNPGEVRGKGCSSQEQGNLSRRQASGAEHCRAPTGNPSSCYDRPTENRRAGTVPNPASDNRSRYPDFDSNSVVRSQVRSDLYRGMLDPFDGSPEKFQSWRAQLLSHLGEARCSPTDCVNILLKNTVGKPKLVIQDYVNNCCDEPESTLQDIWEELEKRFGSNSLVSKCLLDKIHDFEKIESSDHINEMERLLSVCRSAKSKMRTCRQLRVLNYQSELIRIWEKMPHSFQAEWRKKFIRIERETGDSPTLEVLLDSMSDYIDRNSHPVFISKKNSKPTKPARVLHTSITPSATTKLQDKAVEADKSPQKHCIFHDKPGHDLPICYMFKKLSMQDKKKFAFEHRLCYLCLQPHLADKCPGTVICTICKGSHIDSMHREPSVPNSRPLFDRTPAPPSRSQNSGPDLWRRGDSVQPQRSICTMVCGEERAPQKCCSKTLLVQVRIAGQQNYITGYCILDEQSNSSFCDPILPSSFGLDPPRRTYALSTMSGYKSKIDGGIVTGLEARGIGEKRWVSLPELLTHPSIPDTKAEVATRDIVNAHPHISHLSANFPNSASDCKVLLLLGVNCGDAMHTQVYGETYPFAHHTALGWCLVGPVCRDSIRQEEVKALRTTVMQECEHFSTKNCFDTKIKSDLIPRDFDVASYSPEDEFPGMSRHEKRFQDIVETVVHPNARGNLELPLPFIDNPEFPDNRKAVYMRTRNSLLRIKKDEVVLEKCVTTMQNYIDAGHVEQLNPSDRGIVGRTNYIAVFPVTHPNKPGKVRIVFDSAASYSGLSPNDKLLRGPDVANKLIGVMMRFRLGKIAFAADVECMFHSFHVSPEDRDALRFYWWDSNDPTKEVTAYRANVHIFGNKSSPAIATFGLRYTTTDEDAADLIEAKKFILHNFYVDDGMGCANTIEEAISTLKDARTILSKYNIRLHKIISPHSEVLSAFPESELAPELTSLDISSNCSQSALGIRWNIGTDTFNLKCFSPRTEFTRRAVLSVNGSVFDPLGMVSPVSLGGRLLQRKFISSGTEPFG